MEDVLKERREQLETMHQADVDHLKDEHEKNLKNLAQEFQDMVYIIFVLLYLVLTIHYGVIMSLLMHFDDYVNRFSRSYCCTVWHHDAICLSSVSPSVNNAVYSCIQLFQGQFRRLKVCCIPSMKLPIHFFRYLCGTMYRLATKRTINELASMVNCYLRHRLLIVPKTHFISYSQWHFIGTLSVCFRLQVSVAAVVAVSILSTNNVYMGGEQMRCVGL